MSALQEEFRQAVLTNNYDAVEKLIAKGVDVNAADASGETALHLSMRIGSSTDIIQLLDAGADPNKADDEGVTPFMAAVNATKFSNATFAIDYKADVDYQPKPTDMPPLYRAMVFDTINGTVERTAFLLKRGANIDATITQPDGSKKSLIAYALDFDVERGSDALEKLIKNHLNRDIRAEFTAVVRREKAHATVRSILDDCVRADGNKFKVR